MDDEFLNEYFYELNHKLKNKSFTSKIREEFHELDEKKLKKTILYWDNVSSIVPDEDYYRRDIVNMNEDMRYLIDNGIYRPTFPSELFTSSNFDRFNEELERTFISRSSKN